MGLKEDLRDLISELNIVNLQEFHYSKNNGIMDFLTAENGLQRNFTKTAKISLRKVTEILHSNRPLGSLKVEIAIYEKIIQQIIVDFHASGELDDFYENGEKSALGKIKDLAEARLPKADQKYTHYFSAWTAGVEKRAPLKIGPVTLWNRLNWIDSVDFSPSMKENYSDTRSDNTQWQNLLKEALRRPKNDVLLEGLAAPIYDAICNCPAVLGVTIAGYERELSRKLAKLACKTALDSISLFFGGVEYFHQQALYEERLPPVGSASLMESNSYLFLPGKTLGKRIPLLTLQMLDKALNDMAPFLPAFASILDGLVSPENHTFPKLANRWATALDWFGEGNREESDSIAVAKLGTCLDVLACGGKNAGIANMVINITGIDGETVVENRNKPLTLRELVKEIYEDGRSKILHGTYFDRLQPLAFERKRAALLARKVLLESAMRLLHYSGKDSDMAFRTMPPVKK